MIQKPVYEMYHGPVDTPEKHVDWCIFQGRQQGKTTKLIEVLPADKPVAVLCLTMAMAKHLEHDIRIDRPDIDIKNVRFMSKQNFDTQIRGFTGPVYVDNAVLDDIQMDYIKHVNMFRR